MPRVPVYNNNGPSVGEEGLRAPNLGSVANVDDFGAIQARQQVARGQALQRTAGEVASIATDIQNRENADRVQRAEVEYKEKLLEQEVDWQKNRQGRFATDLTSDAAKWHDDTTRAISDQFENPVQRKMFLERSTGVRQSSLKGLAHFQATQLEKAHDESFAANKIASIRYAVANPLPENISATTAMLKKENIRQGARKGWSAEMVEAANVEDTTKLHENIINALIVDDPTGAAAYFEANKGEIAPEKWDNIGKTAKEASAKGIGRDAAASAWRQLGPKDDTAPVNLDKMMAAGRDALKGNEAALQAFEAAIKEQASTFKFSVKERINEKESVISDALASNTPWSKVMAMPEYLGLDGETKAKWNKYVKDEEWRNQQRALTVVQQKQAMVNIEYTNRMRQMAETDRARDENYYRIMQNPDALSKMSDAQLKALVPMVGNKHAAELVAKKGALLKDASALPEAKIDADDFAVVAAQMKLDPNKTDDKPKVAAARSAFENRIDQENAVRRSKGQALLNRQEKQDIMKNELSNVVLIDKLTTGIPIIGSDPEAKPVVQLTPKEQEKGYVLVDNKKIKMTDIPADFRAQYRALMIKEGRQTSELDLAIKWVQVQRMRKPSGQ